jgi:hypothetical protein
VPLAAHVSGEALPPLASAGLAALVTGASRLAHATARRVRSVVLTACALGTGAGAASGALWYYSRRYVGELALTRRSGGAAGAWGGVRISTLDFWGRREEMHVARADVVPPLRGAGRAELAAAARAPILPLDVLGQRQFVLSLRFGAAPDRPELLALLTGDDVAAQEARLAAAAKADAAAGEAA